MLEFLCNVEISIANGQNDFFTVYRHIVVNFYTLIGSNQYLFCACEEVFLDKELEQFSHLKFANDMRKKGSFWTPPSYNLSWSSLSFDFTQKFQSDNLKQKSYRFLCSPTKQHPGIFFISLSTPKCHLTFVGCSTVNYKFPFQARHRSNKKVDYLLKTTHL